MSRDRHKEFVRAALTHVGMTIHDIPEHPTEKRADFEIRVGDDVYVCEAKSRTVSADYARQLAEEDVAFREEAIGRVNSVSARIKEANAQLLATPAPPGSYRVVALVAAGDDPHTQTTQFEYTLYGIKDVLPSLGDELMKKCYYGTYSEFYKYPDIDAAILFTRRGQRLCPNYFNRQHERFRSSWLYKFHESDGSMAFPASEEAAGEAYVADTPFAPDDDKGLEAYIAEKYGLSRPLVINLRSHSAATFVPDQKPDTRS